MTRLSDPLVLRSKASYDVASSIYRQVILIILNPGFLTGMAFYHLA